MKRTHLYQKKKEMADHFKSCITRASYLRNQGYIDPNEFKVIRERILKDQGTILSAFDEVAA